MSETISTIKHKGYTIEIKHDDDPMSPREWDNMGTMSCFHKRYDLGDKHEFKDTEELDAYLETIKENIIFAEKLHVAEQFTVTLNSITSNMLAYLKNYILTSAPVKAAKEIIDGYIDKLNEALRSFKDLFKFPSFDPVAAQQSAQRNGVNVGNTSIPVVEPTP
jgi:hypothetical protein